MKSPGLAGGAGSAGLGVANMAGPLAAELGVPKFGVALPNMELEVEEDPNKGAGVAGVLAAVVLVAAMEAPKVGVGALNNGLSPPFPNSGVFASIVPKLGSFVTAGNAGFSLVLVADDPNVNTGLLESSVVSPNTEGADSDFPNVNGFADVSGVALCF